MRLLFLPILIFSFIISACSSTETLTIPKSELEPEVDGNLANWDRSNSMLEQTDGASFHAYYTENYLYVFVDVRNQTMHRAITDMGLTFYLAHKRDDRHRYGIAYPSGTMNLMRENPGAYRGLTTDPEWMQSASNRRLLSDLEPYIFDRIMIVERFNGRSSAQHGFVDYEQLEAEGIEFATNPERRNYGIEMRIPLDGSSVFGIEKKNLWIGFAIEPPDFRRQSPYYNEGHGMTRDRQQRQRPRQQRSQSSYEKWYRLEIK